MFIKLLFTIVVLVSMRFIFNNSEDDNIKHELRMHNYINVKLTGTDSSLCEEHDNVARTFAGTNHIGKEVSGVVCGGIVKKYVIIVNHKDGR